MVFPTCRFCWIDQWAALAVSCTTRLLISVWAVKNTCTGLLVWVAPVESVKLAWMLSPPTVALVTANVAWPLALVAAVPVWPAFGPEVTSKATVTPDRGPPRSQWQ